MPEWASFLVVASFASLVAAAMYVTYRRRLAREQRLDEFGRRHGLISPTVKVAPTPGIQGFLFNAAYSHWNEGVYKEFRVVAFDYRIGIRHSFRGSGVGVERQIEDESLLQTASKAKLLATRRMGWSFLYTEFGEFMPARMLEPEEIEHLWQLLLDA